MNRFEILSPEEVSLLHSKALHVLEKTGVRVFHQDMLSILADSGFRIDLGKNLVFFKPELAESYVHRAPGSFIMGARSPNRSLEVKEGVMYTRPMSGCHKLIDMDTGVCRHGTAGDVKDIILLMDALDQVDFAAGLLYPWESPVDLADVRLVRLALENTGKHFQCQPYSGPNLRIMIEMITAVSGSEESLREKPLLTVTIAPTSPLQYMGHEIDIMLLAGKYGLPVMIGSTPISGATGPVTLASQLLLMHAENLAGIVMSQAANPGAKVIYGPRPNTMDMRTGSACWGSIEFSMSSVASLQLARYAGCPITDVSGPGTDSITWDEQAGIEKAAGSLLLAAAGTPILSGMGYLETINTASFEQLVIDCEIVGMARRLREGIRIDEETADVEIIDRVGHGGNFLMDPHTLRFMKDEHYFPTIFNRKVRQAWEEEGSRKLHEVARHKARSILSAHRAEALPPEVRRELERIWEKSESHHENVLGHASEGKEST